MASLIFAQAKSIRRKVKETVKQHAELFGDDNIDRDAIGNAVIENNRYEFREILKIAKLLHEDYQEVTNAVATNWYFITIRPKPGVTFYEFYHLVDKYVQRKCINSFTLTFEQKDPEGSGKGFHCHIVTDTKHRSKAECLRDTISTFNKVCADNCIDVKPTRNPKDIVNKYMIAYESDDGHKIATKAGDAIWRSKMKLADIYENQLDVVYPPYEIWKGCTTGPLSSSPETADKSEIVITFM